MDRGKGLLDRLAAQADLPDAVFPGQPLLEVLGDRRVLIENHKGVLEYSCERIAIRMCYGQVIVCGSGLEIARMSKEQLVIQGRIETLTLCRR